MMPNFDRKVSARVGREGRKLLREIRSDARLSRIVSSVRVGIQREVDQYARSRARFCIIIETYKIKPGQSKKFPDRRGAYLVYVPTCREIIANSQAL